MIRNYNSSFPRKYMIHFKTIPLIFLIVVIPTIKMAAQDKDTVDLIKQLEQKITDSPKNQINYTIATFKTTRLIDGHSVENVGKGVMDVKISHRFGTLNSGGYQLFGLDNATMRMGLDYGITRNLMVGIGRST